MGKLYDLYNGFVEFIIGYIWSTPTFVVLLSVGVLFTIWSKFVQFRALTHGFSLVRGKYHDPNHPGAISHFQALSAALSGTVGLGNIGGVALAIQIGGPGALFWMWVTGFLGMAIKSVEVTLAMMYRDMSDPDNPHGGAMFVIANGLGGKPGSTKARLAKIIGGVFCVTLLISAFTGANMFQTWNVADITYSYFKIDTWISGLVLAVATGIVIIGGIKRIGDVAGTLVPFMCGTYLIAGIVILFIQWQSVPEMLMLVVRSAFSPSEAQGAFLGATTWFALTTGLRRALFSNEAGQGTSPIAHSAAKTKEPASEGIVAGLEPFVDTCLVCTLTALVLISTMTWNRDKDGEISGAVTVVQAGEGAFAVQGPTDPKAITLEKSVKPIEPGDRFYLIGKVTDANNSQGNNLSRIFGVVRDKDQNDKPVAAYIAWEAPTSMIEARDQKIFMDYKGAALTGFAFDRGIPGMGKWMVTMACWLFAYSTLISWSYYGEQGVVFLFGLRGILVYRILFCVAAFAATLPGFIQTDTQLGNLADLGTGCMLCANVPIILFMGSHAIGCLRDYLKRLDKGEIRATNQLD